MNFLSAAQNASHSCQLASPSGFPWPKLPVRMGNQLMPRRLDLLAVRQHLLSQLVKLFPG
jgi:hypothetical protein